MKIEGFFPMIDPDRGKILLHRLKLTKIMTSINWLTHKQKETDIHESLAFYGMVFVDCGIFQRFRNDLTQIKVEEYRQKLIEYYKNLKPDLASSLDIPSLISHDQGTKKKRLLWSICNYLFMKERLCDIPLVLGASVFAKEDIDFLQQKLPENNVEILGLGGQVPLIRLADKRPSYGKLVLRMVYQLHENFKEKPIHVYGAGDHRWYSLIRLMGATSSDYASYIKDTMKGQIIVPGSMPKYLSERIQIKTRGGIKTYIRPNFLLMDEDEKALLRLCDCPACKNFDPPVLEQNYKLRLVHNLYVIIKENVLVDTFCKNNDNLGLLNHIKERLIKKSDSLKEVTQYCLKQTSRKNN